MESLNASDAKREFGELLIRSQRGPVEIRKNGKPVAVMVSAQEYAELEALKLMQLKAEAHKGLDDINNGETFSAEEVFNLMRKRNAES